MKLPIRSLRALTLAFLLAFFAATLVTGMLTLSTTRATISDLVDKRITSISREIEGDSGDPRPVEIVKRIEDYAGQRHTGDLGMMLTDASGRWVAGNIRTARALPLGYSNVGHADGIEGLSEGRALARRIANGMVLTTIGETEPFDGYNRARIGIYVGGFGSIILVVIAGLIAFGLLVRARIGAMRRAVDAIIDGDMTRRVAVDGSASTFDQQAQAFNRMLDRIGELMAGIVSVSNDIAHDMRTPLARLRSKLTRLAARADDPQQRAELEDVIAESDELLAMFASILRIAEVQGGDRSAGFATMDLGELVSATAAMMQPVAQESGHKLEFDVAAGVQVLGDRQLLGQALVNLIENGMRHTPPGGHIHVTLTASAQEARLMVRDDGPGIPADSHALALRRFGRLDRSRSQPGHGLGLSLVEAILRLHRGTIALGDAVPGLVVTLSLPLKAPR